MSIIDTIRRAVRGDDDQEEEPPVDECPMGGEHDVVETRTATRRQVLRRYCKNCRQSFPIETVGDG